MNELSITRVVHASVLLNFGGHIILTDPWFSQLYGHYWGELPGVPLAELPHLTGVLVSHKDYDHFDMQTFSAYPDKDVPFIARRGIADIASAQGFKNICEMEPWESATLGPYPCDSRPRKTQGRAGSDAKHLHSRRGWIYSLFWRRLAAYTRFT